MKAASLALVLALTSILATGPALAQRDSGNCNGCYHDQKPLLPIRLMGR